MICFLIIFLILRKSFTRDEYMANPPYEKFVDFLSSEERKIRCTNDDKSASVLYFNTEPGNSGNTTNYLESKEDNVQYIERYFTFPKSENSVDFDFINVQNLPIDVIFFMGELFEYDEVGDDDVTIKINRNIPTFFVFRNHNGIVKNELKIDLEITSGIALLTDDMLQMNSYKTLNDVFWETKTFTFEITEKMKFVKTLEFNVKENNLNEIFFVLHNRNVSVDDFKVKVQFNKKEVFDLDQWILDNIFFIGVIGGGSVVVLVCCICCCICIISCCCGVSKGIPKNFEMTGRNVSVPSQRNRSESGRRRRRRRRRRRSRSESDSGSSSSPEEFEPEDDDKKMGPVLARPKEEEYEVRRETVPPEEQCVICLDFRKVVKFQPCGHICCCETCSKQLLSMETKACPLCRVNIKKSEVVKKLVRKDKKLIKEVVKLKKESGVLDEIKNDIKTQQKGGFQPIEIKTKKKGGFKPIRV